MTDAAVLPPDAARECVTRAEEGPTTVAAGGSVARNRRQTCDLTPATLFRHTAQPGSPARAGPAVPRYPPIKRAFHAR